MPFCGVSDVFKRNRDSETLVIFGPERARTGASLKIMSAAECKVPGFYSDKYAQQ